MDGRRLMRLTMTLGILASAQGLRATPAESPILQRFLTIDGRAPHQYRALRRFEARNDKLDKSAWMDVWTEADDAGFRYDVMNEGGSEYIRSKVFLKALETERQIWRDGSGTRGAITSDNYLFGQCAGHSADLTCFTLTPRRKDVMLVDGSIFLHAETGDLVRLEGSLSKSPSFWTRHVDVLRRYERIGGVRVPVALESTATVRLAGLSTFTITYEYETVNGTRVGSPVATVKSQVASR